MIGRDFVQPCRERTRLVILAEFVSQLHKNLHRGIFRILFCGHSPAAEPEDGWGILLVKVAPSQSVPCPSPGDQFRRFSLSRRAHSPWSRWFHNLIRSSERKTITSCYFHEA